jgi:hypothetical protein
MPDGSSIAHFAAFAKKKSMPPPRRVAGGGSRDVYYRQPDRVKVVRGKDINGTRSSAAPDGD